MTRRARVLLALAAVLGLYMSTVSVAVATRERATPSVRGSEAPVHATPGVSTAAQRVTLPVPASDRSYRHVRHFGAFLGQPWELYWFAWFAALFVGAVSLGSLTPAVQDSLLTWLHGTLVLTFGASVYCAHWMLSAGQISDPSVIAWAANAIALLLVAMHHKGAPGSLGRRLRAVSGSHIVFVVPGAAFSAALLLSWAARWGAGPKAPPGPQWATAAEFVSWVQRQPRVALPFPGDSPVVLVKLIDYQCPPCRRAHLMYRRLEEKYRSSEVSFVTVDFPPREGMQSEHRLGSASSLVRSRGARASGSEARSRVGSRRLVVLEPGGALPIEHPRSGGTARQRRFRGFLRRGAEPAEKGPGPRALAPRQRDPGLFSQWGSGSPGAERLSRRGYRCGVAKGAGLGYAAVTR